MFAELHRCSFNFLMDSVTVISWVGKFPHYLRVNLVVRTLDWSINSHMMCIYLTNWISLPSSAEAYLALLRLALSTTTALLMWINQSADLYLQNSIDDLSSIASTQTRLRLQLKRVKLFSLRKFKNSQNQQKLSMHSSNESMNRWGLLCLSPIFPS